MPEEDDVAAASAQIAAVMANLRDVMEPVLEATRGYRAQLVDMDLPEDIIGEMTGEYHKMLMGMLIAGIKAKQ